MLTEKSLFEYRKQYPEDKCYFVEPGCQLLIENKVENLFVISPINETDEKFFDRLSRSRKIGYNLFYEEFEPYEFDEKFVY